MWSPKSSFLDLCIPRYPVIVTLISKKEQTHFFLKFFCYNIVQSLKEKAHTWPPFPTKVSRVLRECFPVKTLQSLALGRIRKVSQLRCLWSIVWLQGQQRGPGLICLGRGMRPVVHIMRKKKKVAGSPCGSNTKAIYLGMRLDFPWPSWSIPFSFKIKKKKFPKGKGREGRNKLGGQD